MLSHSAKIRSLVLLVATFSLSASLVEGAQIQVPLNYNLDSVYHGTGDTQYHSISDRGLVWDGSTVSTGSGTVVSTQGLHNVTSATTGLSYTMVPTANTLDTVALTPRGGLPSGNYTSNTTNMPEPIQLNGSSIIGLLYNYSDSGGSFKMTLNFSNAAPITLTLSAQDWVGGSANAPAAGVASQTIVSQAGFGNGSGQVDGVGNHDTPTIDLQLKVTEAEITAASLQSGFSVDINGDVLTSITFNGLNGSSPTMSAVGIYAATLTGTFVPEPSSVILGVCGGLGLLLAARRRRQANHARTTIVR